MWVNVSANLQPHLLLLLNNFSDSERAEVVIRLATKAVANGATADSVGWMSYWMSQPKLVPVLTSNLYSSTSWTKSGTRRLSSSWPRSTGGNVLRLCARWATLVRFFCQTCVVLLLVIVRSLPAPPPT